jgi:erythromycin esterase-like protein
MAPPLRPIRRAAIPLADRRRADERFLELVGEADLVLIGLPTHGTAEAYAERAALTRLLIEAGGFDAVAIEADWPDAYRVDRYVRGESADAHAEAALRNFVRFPAWPWRNVEIARFVEWLRSHNEGASRTVRFHGLDLYSLWSSLEAIVAYLDPIDPDAADRARGRYAAFEHVRREGRRERFAGRRQAIETREDAVIAHVLELRRRTLENELQDADPVFAVLERTLPDPERYYRSLFHGRQGSWSVRDAHMADTLDTLAGHDRATGGSGRVVVWAHNTHAGDARATQLGAPREISLGQLARERHPGQVRLVGTTTASGTVTAADDWDRPPRTLAIRPPLDGSYELLFHEVGIDRFLIALDPDGASGALLDGPHLERAIGVVYRPETERETHYFDAILPEQFDAVVHLDRTTAVEPLDVAAGRTIANPSPFTG